MVAAASAAALLFIMSALTWFKVQTGPGGRDAWQTFTLIDLVLFLVVLTTIGLAVACMAGIDLRSLPVRPGRIVAAAGAIAFLSLLFRFFVIPEIEIQFPGATGRIETDAGDIDRGIGLYLGLVASAGIAVGGYAAVDQRARRSSRRR